MDTYKYILSDGFNLKLMGFQVWMSLWEV